MILLIKLNPVRCHLMEYKVMSNDVITLKNEESHYNDENDSSMRTLQCYYFYLIICFAMTR